VIGEPLPGQSLDHFGKRCGAGGIQIGAAASDDRKDPSESRAIGELGMHPHRHLHERVGHHDHPASTRSCG
jgi:hypothetical protein